MYTTSSYTDDPNPVAQDSISRADKDALTALLAAKGVSTAAAPFEYPSDYQIPPDAKRLRLEGGEDLAQEHPELAYPNTDHQYTSSTSSTSASVGVATVYNIGPVPEGYNMTQEQYVKYCTDYYNAQAAAATATTTAATEDQAETKGKLSSYLSDLLKPTTTPETTSSSSNLDSQSSPATYTPASSAWGEFLDEDTGATYYYNAATGESSWETPADLAPG